MGSPPEFLPVAFKSKNDCEYHLSSKIINKYENFNLVSNNESKYLINYMNNKFIIPNNPLFKNFELILIQEFLNIVTNLSDDGRIPYFKNLFLKSFNK